MKVSVDVEDLTFWKLAAIAERYEMRVDEFMQELALSASNRRVDAEVDPVAMRWRQGLSDKEIARELGMTNQAVSVRRRSHGLPANRAIGYYQPGQTKQQRNTIQKAIARAVARERETPITNEGTN